MASGAILGECPACKEWVYEDEWTIFGNRIRHSRCLNKAIAEVHGVSTYDLIETLEHRGYEVIRRD